MLGILIKAKLKGFISILFGMKKREIFISLVVVLALAIGGPYFFYFMFEEIVLYLIDINMTWFFFSILGIMMFALCFMGSVFLVQQELYGSKDNDLLLSMPLKQRDILLSRLLSVLLTNYIYILLLVIPAIVISIDLLKFNLIQLIFLFIIFITFPLLSMTFTCLISYIIVTIMAKVKFKKLIQIVLYLFFFGAYIYFVSGIQDVFALFMNNIDAMTNMVKMYLPPLYFMSNAIINLDFMMLFIYLLMAIVPFILVVIILESNFNKIITAKKEVYTVKDQKIKHNKTNYKIALIKKELRQFGCNTTVILNGLLGSLLLFIGTCVMLYQSNNLNYILSEIRIIDEIMWLFVFVVCLLNAYISSLNFYTAFSISLEGKSFPITKSLPVESMDLFMAKIAMQLLLIVPVTLFCSFSSIFVFKFNIIQSIVVVLVPLLLTILVAFLGLIINLWKPKFDWVNEAACVKRSIPVVLTMFSSILFIGLLCALGFYAISYITITVFFFILIVFLILIISLLYFCLETYGVKKFEKL